MRLVVVILAAVIAIAGCTRSTGGTAAAPPGTKPDEASLRDVVERFEQAWNDRRFDMLRNLMCTEMRTHDEFDDDGLRAARSAAGRLDLAITELEITGDRATAIIENGGEDPDDIAFQREDDSWKWCAF